MITTIHCHYSCCKSPRKPFHRHKPRIRNTITAEMTSLRREFLDFKILKNIQRGDNELILIISTLDPAIPLLPTMREHCTRRKKMSRRKESTTRQHNNTFWSIYSGNLRGTKAIPQCSTTYCCCRYRLGNVFSTPHTAGISLSLGDQFAPHILREQKICKWCCFDWWRCRCGWRTT